MDEFWNLENADYADVSGLTKCEEYDSQLDEKIEALRKEITDQCPDVKEKLYKLMHLCSEKNMVQNKIGFWLGNKHGYEVYENIIVKKKNPYYKKPSKSFLLKSFVYTLTRLTYRDSDELEELHTQSQVKTADMSFYNQMFDTIRMLFDKYYSHLKSLFADIPPSNRFEMDLKEYIGYLLAEMSEWDTPKTIKEAFSGEIAEFVLSGTFKTACENHHSLTDAEMHLLNQDVYNRYYTLVLKGII